MTKEGIVQDRNGRIFNQVGHDAWLPYVKLTHDAYRRGSTSEVFGGSEQMVFRMVSGMFSVGCSDQIKETYQVSCMVSTDEGCVQAAPSSVAII